MQECACCASEGHHSTLHQQRQTAAATGSPTRQLSWLPAKNLGGSHPESSAAFTSSSPDACSSARSTPAMPWWAAQCTAPRPPSRPRAVAPAASSCSAQRRWPPARAASRGLAPWESAAFGSAPRRSSASTTCAWPASAASRRRRKQQQGGHSPSKPSKGFHRRTRAPARLGGVHSRRAECSAGPERCKVRCQACGSRAGHAAQTSRPTGNLAGRPPMPLQDPLRAP